MRHDSPPASRPRSRPASPPRWSPPSPRPPPRRPRPPAAVAARAPLATTTDGCLAQPARAGHGAAGEDLLHGLQAGRRLARPPGPVHHAQPRLGRLAHHGPGRRSSRWLDAGYGVLSFDQRGFGESGGFAHVENPRFEGIDNVRLIRLVSPAAVGAARTARATRGSARSAAATAAATSTSARSSRCSAAAPRSTTRSPPRSPGTTSTRASPRRAWCAPSGRTPCRAAAAPTDALPPQVYEALVEGSATGEWPDGSGPSGVDMPRFFRRNGPRWHVDQGRRLDIPVLIGQGHTDTLFNLQQALDNWRTALTPAPAGSSIFVGYNGGHVLPAVLPAGHRRQLRPVQRAARGRRLRRPRAPVHGRAAQGPRPRPARLRRATTWPPATARCTTVGSVAAGHDPRGRHRRDPRGGRRPARLPGRRRARSGSPGSPYFTGRLTALGAREPRASTAWRVGTSPADAELVQNNVYPLNEDGAGRPASGAGSSCRPSRSTCPAGQNLYLIAVAGQRHLRRHEQPYAGRDRCSTTRSSISRWWGADRPTLERVRLRIGLLVVALAAVVAGLAPAARRPGDPAARRPRRAERPPSDDQPRQTSDGAARRDRRAAAAGSVPREPRVEPRALVADRARRPVPPLGPDRLARAAIRAYLVRDRPVEARRPTRLRLGPHVPDRGPLTQLLAPRRRRGRRQRRLLRHLRHRRAARRRPRPAARLPPRRAATPGTTPSRSTASGRPRIGPVTMQAQHRRAPADRDHQRELPAGPRGQDRRLHPRVGYDVRLLDHRRPEARRPDGRGRGRPGRRPARPDLSSGKQITGSVLVGRGPGADQLAELRVGVAATVAWRLPDRYRRSRSAARRVLLREGRVRSSDDVYLHPRTAVGIDRDTGRVLLLVVDGRQDSQPRLHAWSSSPG